MGRARLYSLDETIDMVFGQSEVEFDAVDPEDTSWPAEVTQYPVESGRNIAEHVQLRPITVDIQGVVAGPEAAHKVFLLRKWRDRRDRVKYVGRNIFSGYVIVALDTEHSRRVRDGFWFEITLEQVRVAKPEVADVTGDDPGGG